MNKTDNSTKLYTVSNDLVVKFASDELSKYIKFMSGGITSLIGTYINGCNCETESSLCLGLFTDFSLNDAPTVVDAVLDDAIYIDVENGHGIIAGVNPRSVLLAVYRLLTEAGCRWVRPSVEGEFIPEKDLSSISVKIIEKPSYRHRGICIEGAVSYENVVDMVEWAPKLGFNTYFIQFREAYTFFDRWYSHRSNPYKLSEEFTVEKAIEYTAGIVNEIKKRGMLYQAVGHGWTCESLGIKGLGWDPNEYNIPEKTRKYLAQVDGKREIWKDIPLNTNLCFSNPEVRKLMIDSIVEYIEVHPQCDILHFWLADASNNQCECENCMKMNPSDYYVIMMNELDEQLVKHGLNTKIVFLIYFDLMWTPKVENIKNPDRFILMFAPITRTYSKSFDSGEKVDGFPPYVRNKLKMPSSIAENLSHLKEWQKVFKGDSFDFDYHLMWDHYNDPGYISIGRILNQDIKLLKKIGLNGFVSCQVQRAFFPTGIPMYVMGRTLWNDCLEFDSIAKEYFEGAFGMDGELCRQYLTKISGYFDPPYLRNEKPQISEESVKLFAEITAVIAGFRPLINRNKQIKVKAHQKSWEYMGFHAEICLLLAQALEAKASGDDPRAKSVRDNLKRYVQANEDSLQPVLDVFEYINVMDSKI